jgi:predicted membrane-bound mannosyltransferase
MLLSMAFYGYVQEKVPWLLIHQLLPIIFVAVYKLNWQKVVFALVGMIFLAVITWHVAFIPIDINEPIVQVQNSEDLRQVMTVIDHANHVTLASKNYWPLPWYYRGDRWNKITFYADKQDEKTLTDTHPDVIILYDADSYDSLDGYTKNTYKLDYWFSFYDNQNRLLDYYIHRDGKMGSMNLDVFTKNSI